MIIWHDDAWFEYLEGQKLDSKKFSKLNSLTKEVMRGLSSGTGKPGPLKGNLFGFWSQRIDKEHRLVYRVCEDGVEIAQCRGHH